MTNKKVEFGNFGRLSFAFFPACSAKSVTSRSLPRLPFFLAFRTLPAHFIKNISTHCRQMHSALSKFSKGSHISRVSKKSATAISLCRGPSQCCFGRFCPWIINRCFFSRNPPTHTFFHLLNIQKLRCTILLANCFKEKSVYSNLIGALPLAPPKSNELSLS